LPEFMREVRAISSVNYRLLDRESNALSTKNMNQV
jgi:hypothetical protein